MTKLRKFPIRWRKESHRALDKPRSFVQPTSTYSNQQNKNNCFLLSWLFSQNPRFSFQPLKEKKTVCFKLSIIMIKGCGMGLLLLVLSGLFFSLPDGAWSFDEDLWRHHTLETFCKMIVKQRIHRQLDLENTCVMNVAFFKDRVRSLFFPSNKMFCQPDEWTFSFSEEISKKFSEWMTSQAGKNWTKWISKQADNWLFLQKNQSVFWIDDQPSWEKLNKVD